MKVHYKGMRACLGWPVVSSSITSFPNILLNYQEIFIDTNIKDQNVAIQTYNVYKNLLLSTVLS